MSEQQKTFTLEELVRCDGKDGRPAYVVHKGRVFDLSDSKLWKTGRHMNRHDAGLDLTADLEQAPHTEELLARYPQVGVVAETAGATPAGGQHSGPNGGQDQAQNPGQGSGPNVSVSPTRNQAPDHAPSPAPKHDDQLPWLLRKYPYLRRHPHPMTVHFPIAFATGAVFFLALFLACGSDLFEAGVHAMNLIGALFTPVAILTGLATWKYNYGASLITAVRVKLILSPVLLTQFVAAASWWCVNPEVLSGGGGDAALFTGLVLSMLPVMGVIGWLGAGLTFPMHE